MYRTRRPTALYSTLLTLAIGVGVLGLSGGGAEGAAICEPVDCKALTPAQCVVKQKEHHGTAVKTARAMLAAGDDQIKEAPADKRELAGKLWNMVKTNLVTIDKSEKDAAAAVTATPTKVSTLVADSTALACETALHYASFEALVTPPVPPTPATNTSTTPPVPTAPKPPTEPEPPAAPNPGEFPNKESICEAKCQSKSAFCIDVEDGQPFCKDAKGAKGDFGLPGELREGQSWAVRVIGPTDSTIKFDVTVGEVKSPDSLFRTAPPPDPAKGRSATVSFKVLKEVPYTVPSASDVISVQVLFTRTSDRELSERYEVPVNHGKYYLDIGVLIPIVPFGEREIVQTPIPGTGGERRLSLREDWQVEAALALNVFPCGRRRGLYSAFQRVSVDTLCDLFGLQLGLDLDFKNAFQRIYAGVILEPIAGLGAGFGVALVKGQFFPDGHADGMLVPRGETFTPDTDYMVRPYLGITLSTDILTSLSAASAELKSKF